MDIPAAYRSNYDNSEMSKIELPDGWDFCGGQIISDEQGNLYVAIIRVDDTNRGECRLVKLDFGKKTCKELLSSQSEKDAFTVIGLYNNEIVLSIYPSYLDGMPSLVPAKENIELKLFSPKEIPS
ncbi:MAG: hypothetical protein RR981_00030 [Oscillospiraceae bacterium]